MALPVESESAKGSESERKGDWTLAASRVEEGRGNSDEWRSGLEMFGVAAMEKMVGGKEDMVVDAERTVIKAGARPGETGSTA